MITRLIEATRNLAKGWNHGKFMVARFDLAEWAHRCALDAEVGLERSLLSRCGWSPRHVVVLDLQTGEGAIFLPGGLASADLERHRVHVCPMFEPFLAWLYKQDLGDLSRLPEVVELPDAEGSAYGHRRSGRRRRRANGAGSVYRRNRDGRWCAAVTLPWGREIAYAANEEEARERLVELLKRRPEAPRATSSDA